MSSPGSDCPSGKIQFTAQAAQDKVAYFHAIGDFGMTAYTCVKCGCCHVGHKDARRRSGPRHRRRVS